METLLENAQQEDEYWRCKFWDDTDWRKCPVSGFRILMSER